MEIDKELTLGEILMSSQDAKTRSNNNKDIQLKQEIKTLNQMIFNQSGKGLNVVHIATITEQAIIILRHKGYIVDYDTTSPFPVAMYKISW